MRTYRVLGITLFLFSLSLTSFAQATRTWVSGVGDDANPCSRTAPCKTFAGAISKTAAGGEISVLDPGGYGAVTITKSITIQGADFVASALTSGVNGFVINAPSGNVYLRNLSINGAGTTLGVNGVRVLAASHVTVEHCNIFDYGTSGIDIEPSAASVVRVSITDTTIRDVAGFGVFIKPANAGLTFVDIENSTITGTTTTAATGSGSAVYVDTGSSAQVTNCILSNNGGAGLFVRNGSDVNVMNSSIFRNTTGVSVGDVGSGTVRLFGSSVYANSTGLAILTSGSCFTHGNNAIQGNGGNQTPTLPSLGLQ